MNWLAVAMCIAASTGVRGYAAVDRNEGVHCDVQNDKGIQAMWVNALNIVVLVSMLAVLGYVLLSARRLEQALIALADEQAERMRRIERDLDRVRQSLDSVSTGVMAIDIRQRMSKKREAVIG